MFSIIINVQLSLSNPKQQKFRTNDIDSKQTMVCKTKIFFEIKYFKSTFIIQTRVTIETVATFLMMPAAASLQSSGWTRSTEAGSSPSLLYRIRSQMKRL